MSQVRPQHLFRTPGHRYSTNKCQQEHHTVSAKLLHSWARAVEVEYVFTVEERSDESVNKQRPPTVIDASVCHCACVCLRSQCSLCVCPGAVCTKQPLFRRKLKKCREKIAETSTIRSLSPVTVDAEVLRNLAITAKTLVYNRRTAEQPGCSSARQALCSNIFVLCQLLSLNRITNPYPMFPTNIYLLIIFLCNSFRLFNCNLQN